MSSNECKAYCKYRKFEIPVRAHRNDLLSHASTAKHLKNAAPFSSQRSLFDVGCSKVVLDTSVKVTDLKVATHIACPSSTSTVNTLENYYAQFLAKILLLIASNALLILNECWPNDIF